MKKGERVRIRFGNLSMDSHPIHLHGYHFEMTGTDGGPIPRAAQWPETTVERARRARRATSSSSPTRPATGRSTATSRTTR